MYKTPAAWGTKGSVRELVKLAHYHGFYWGGDFGSQDGMHFEVYKISDKPSMISEAMSSLIPDYDDC